MDSNEDQRLDEIEEEISSLLGSRTGIISQLKTLHQKSNDLNDKMRSVSSRFDSGRKDLKSDYSESRSFRESRGKVLEEIRVIRTTISSLQGIMAESEKSSGIGNEKMITDQLDQVDWKLQTAKLTRDEEKELVECIRILEGRLSKLKKASATRQELEQLFGVIREMKVKLNDIEVFRDNLQEKITAKKDAVTADLTTYGNLSGEMNRCINDIINLDGLLQKEHDQISQLKTKKHEILKTIKSRDDNVRAAKRAVTIKEETGKAKQKLHEGKSLSLEELKLAFDHDDEYLK